MEGCLQVHGHAAAGMVLEARGDPGIADIKGRQEPVAIQDTFLALIQGTLVGANGPGCREKKKKCRQAGNSENTHDYQTPAPTSMA